MTTDASDKQRAKDNFFDIVTFLESIRNSREGKEELPIKFKGEAGTKKLSVDRGRYMTFSQEMKRIQTQDNNVEAFMNEAG